MSPAVKNRLTALRVGLAESRQESEAAFDTFRKRNDASGLIPDDLRLDVAYTGDGEVMTNPGSLPGVPANKRQK